MHLKQINLDRILNKETANTGKKTTPMMEQYLEVKSRHKDHLLFTEWVIFTNFSLMMQ